MHAKESKRSKKALRQNPIRKYRLYQLAMTRAELANALGVHVDSISNWETGDNLPNIQNIRPLADLLKMDSGKLVAEIDHWFNT